MGSSTRYYLVERSALGMYGDERGVETLDELNALLKGVEDTEMVAIRGEELTLEFKVPEAVEISDEPQPCSPGMCNC